LQRWSTLQLQLRQQQFGTLSSLNTSNKDCRIAATSLVALLAPLALLPPPPLLLLLLPPPLLSVLMHSTRAAAA